MKTTAVLHATATGLVAAGVLLVEGVPQVALFGVGGILFVAGILVARRNDSGPPDVK